MINGKPVNLGTLTDISQFLQEQNIKLDGQMSVSGDALGALMGDLDQLQTQIGGNEQFRSIQSRITCVKDTANEVRRQ